MKLRSSSGLACIFMVVGQTNCFVPKATGQKMQTDIGSLQGDVQAAKKGLDEQRARLEEQMQRAEKKIVEVSTAVADFNRAVHLSDADFGVRLEQLVKETQDLRGMLEQLDFRLGKIETLLGEKGDLTERLAAIESTLGINKKSATTVGDSKAENAADPNKMLTQAKDLAKAGKINEARGVYRNIVQQWPGKPGITDEAYFRLGELYVDENLCRNALTEFVKVVESFPTGEFTDDALYRIGICSMQLGNLEDAQLFFNEIIKSHKRSPLVSNAKRKLDEIEKQLAKDKNKNSGKNSKK